MNRLVRACGLLVAAAVAISGTGCGKSENEGKLEGTKWASAYIPEFKGVKNATATVSFTEGGRFTMELRVPQGAIRMSGTWRLGPGSMVYLENVAPAMQGQSSFAESITVNGDVMTMEEANLKIVFTRIDEEMEKAAKTGTPPARRRQPRRTRRGKRPTGTGER